jgi:hypothetical protein
MSIPLRIKSNLEHRFLKDKQISIAPTEVAVSETIRNIFLARKAHIKFCFPLLITPKLK